MGDYFELFKLFGYPIHELRTRRPAQYDALEPLLTNCAREIRMPQVHHFLNCFCALCSNLMQNAAQELPKQKRLWSVERLERELAIFRKRQPILARRNKREEPFRLIPLYDDAIAAIKLTDPPAACLFELHFTRLLALIFSSQRRRAR